MGRRLIIGGVQTAIIVLMPACAWAAEKATDLVVVSDTRALSGFSLYLGTVYNQNLWLFAVWSVVLTTALGVGLGILMDLIMSSVGLDLTKGGGHVEH